MKIHRILKYTLISFISIPIIFYLYGKKQQLDYKEQNPQTCTYIKDNGYILNEALGGITDAKFTITNTCSFDVKDIRVVVTYIRKNNDIYKQEFVNIPYLKAGTNNSYNAPNSSQGVSLKYEIHSLNSVNF